MSDNGLIWEDPPAAKTKRGAGNAERFVEVLRLHPGKWAVYDRRAKSNKTGHAAARFPGTEWTGRMNDDGSWCVYVRWLGDVCDKCGQVRVVTRAEAGR